MSGWGSWAAGIAKAATTQVAQFGQDYIDSVTAIDEPDDDNRDAAKALFDLDEEQQRKIAAQKRAEAEVAEAAAEAEEANAAEASKSGSASPTTSPTSAVPASKPLGGSASPAGGAKKGLKGASKLKATKIRTDGAKPKPTAAEAERSSWIPKEFEFARAQGRTLLGLGRDAVEAGAGVALEYLPPDEDGATAAAKPAAAAASDAPKPAAKPTSSGWGDDDDGDDGWDAIPEATAPPREVAAAAAAAATTAAPSATKKPSEPEHARPPQLSDFVSFSDDPFDDLRFARGAATNALSSAALAALLPGGADGLIENVDVAVDSATIGEFIVDEAEDVAADLEWIAATPVGRRIRTARREATVLLSDATGEPMSADELAAELQGLPKRVAEAATTIAGLVAEELVGALSAPRISDFESVPKATLSALLPAAQDCGWWPTSAGGSSEIEATAVAAAKNVRALVAFAQCETAAVTTALCDLAAEAAAQAKKAGRSDAKQVREASLTARGDCHVEASCEFAALEEAAECAAIAVAACCAMQRLVEVPAPIAAEAEQQPSDNAAATPAASPAVAEVGSTDVTGDVASALASPQVPDASDADAVADDAEVVAATPAANADAKREAAAAASPAKAEDAPASTAPAADAAEPDAPAPAAAAPAPAPKKAKGKRRGKKAD